MKKIVITNFRIWNNEFNLKELEQQTAKWSLLLIKIMKYGIVQFVCYIIITGKSKLWINTKYSLLKINLHEQQACTFVKFSNIDKNWPFVTLISVAPPLDPKTFDTKNYLKMLLTSVVKKKIDQRLGRIWKIWKMIK